MLKYIVFVTYIVLAVGKQSDEVVDPIIDMLLNGASGETNYNRDLNATLVPAGGIWKCGNCTNLEEARLTLSEVNIVDLDVDSSEVMDVQLSLTTDTMRCVTVMADRPGAVHQVLSTCNGSSVTLSLSPYHNFTVLVYTST